MQLKSWERKCEKKFGMWIILCSHVHSNVLESCIKGRVVSFWFFWVISHVSISSYMSCSMVMMIQGSCSCLPQMLKVQKQKEPLICTPRQVVQAGYIVLSYIFNPEFYSNKLVRIYSYTSVTVKFRIETELQFYIGLHSGLWWVPNYFFIFCFMLLT